MFNNYNNIKLKKYIIYNTIFLNNTIIMNLFNIILLSFMGIIYSCKDNGNDTYVPNIYVWKGFIHWDCEFDMSSK